MPHLDFDDDARAEWEWSAEEIRRVGYQVVDLIAHHLASLPARPVFRPFPPELAEEMLATPLPREGRAPDEILAEFRERIEPYPFGNGHPRFHAWVNPPPTPMGIFGEALAAAMNPSVAGGNHAATHLEHQVVAWLRQLVGFPAESAGLLVGGGSAATLTALAVARHNAARADGADVRAAGVAGLPRRLVAYATEEGHTAIRKALEVLGIGSDSLRLVPTDAERRMRPEALDGAIAADLRAGHRPLAVTASAGTAGTGAIDPLGEIADVCARHSVWLHVDGAYGAPALLSERYRDALAPLARADSLALDPHKWLYVPVEAGLVLVRDAAAMRDTFSLVPSYLKSEPLVAGPPWFSEFGMQQTRGFRALKVWMALAHHGVRGYTAAVERDLALAEHLAALVEAAPDLELLARGLSIVCFRYAPPELRGDEARLDALNRAALLAVQLGGEAFLSGTVVGGRFALRACQLNPRTTAADLAGLVELVRRAGRDG